MDERVKEIVRRLVAGESWRVINEAIPGAFNAYWKARGAKERKRKADREYQAKKRLAARKVS